MLKLINNRLSHYFIFTICVIFVLSFFFLFQPQKVNALAAYCKEPQSHGPVLCTNISAINKKYPIETTTFKTNSCYALTTTGFGPVWLLKKCGDPPFDQLPSDTGTTGGTEREIGGVKFSSNNCSFGVSATSADNCRLYTNYLLPIIDFLAVGVGIVSVIMIVWGGIEYSSASSDPNKTARAKHKITNALIALFSFAVFWSFLQWLVPGGIF